jgi:hypothetical protein
MLVEMLAEIKVLKNSPSGYFFLDTIFALVLRHRAQTFIFFPPIFFVWRFTARTLFEAMLECERLWAERGPRPQIWQTLDI